MIKVTDYITKRLVEYGVKDVFMISGGGAMHLVDSVGRQKGLRYVCPHHEQAAAIAAEGYSRVSGKIGVVVVTSGPGGTNTLTGVIGQWLDSVPCLYLSGQVKRETTIAAYPKLNLRQLGDQEINIADIVKPVTKYAAMVWNPNDIRYQLEKAVYLATHGRPGPVWLDIPLDIQASMVDERSLRGYEEKNEPVFQKAQIVKSVDETVGRLIRSKRPVIICGNGIRLSGKQNQFLALAEKLKIPLLATFNGFDLIPSEHKLFAGRIGTVGDRAGNFALQNADFVLSIGSRNNIRQVSYDWKSFARRAFKVFVDIDKAELLKPTVKPDIQINSDAGVFIDIMRSSLSKTKLPDWNGWLAWCRERKEKYPVVLPEYKKIKRFVQPYYFIQALTKNLTKDMTVVAGNGTACVTLFQAGIVRKGQRMFWNSGCASMGYDLPAAIGACIAGGKKKTICLAGDGSLMMNVQELQTVAHGKLPLKIFVLNNYGYISIKQTQDSFFGKRVACDASCGVSFPDIRKVGEAFGLSTEVIESHVNIENKIKKILNSDRPCLCEVRLTPEYKFAPKLSSEKMPDGRMVSKPLEDMYPFLDRKEFIKNIITDNK